MSFFKAIPILLFVFLIEGQVEAQDWERWYGSENLDFTNEGILEDFDNGILVAGNLLDFDNLMVYPKILKTTINGDTLWSKIFLNSEYIGLKKIKKAIDGGTYICGGFRINNESKPFAAKLDVCGEKEWCTIFETYRESSYAYDVVETYSGDIGVIVNSFDEIDKLYLFKLDSLGNLSWKKPVCRRSDYPDSRQPFGRSLKITSNGDFLIAGDVYWKNPWDDLFPTRSLFAMIDQEGNERWVLPFGLNDSIHSHSLNIVEQPNGNFIGLGAYWSPSKKTPDSYFIPNESKCEKNFDYEYRNGLLMEIDPNGNELNYFISDFTDIDPAFKYQVFSDLFFVDSVAIIGGIFTDDTQFGNSGEIVIDTNFFDEDFNVYYRIKHENAYEPLSYAITSDNKMLCASTDWHTYDDYTMYLTKLNRYLEQDSIYNEPYEYDYLCGHEIESGTIYFDDCNMIVDVDESIIETNSKASIRIIPNPVRSIATIKFDGLEELHDLKLYIVDILGNHTFSSNLLKGQTELRLNTNSWKKGLYVLRLTSRENTILTKKIVKI